MPLQLQRRRIYFQVIGFYHLSINDEYGKILAEKFVCTLGILSPCLVVV